MGENINARINNCTLRDDTFIVSKGGGIYITNSTLKDSDLKASNGTLYMENCQSNGGQLSSGTIVVRKSMVNAPLLGGGQGKQWHITGTHLLKHHSEPDVLTSFEPHPGTHVYINGENEPAYLYLDKANIHIRNLELIDVYARDSSLQNLDLQNVKIRGGNWESLKLGGGQWENVQIYPTVDITGSTIENIQGYNVTFPEGTPWKGKSAGGASMTVSKTPFEWPEVKVPTPKELGLEWEWPEITGAPKGK